MTYLGLLQQVTNIDWNLQQTTIPNQKRAIPMSDYSIKINCQPELLKFNKYEDFREGTYLDTVLKEFFANTPALQACVNAVQGTTPYIVLQKGVGGQQPHYTIFICPAAKYLLNPQYTLYNSLTYLLRGATMATLWKEFVPGTNPNWNLGNGYSINRFLAMDSMILAALLAIAQGQESQKVEGPTDPWQYCFQSNGANWNDPGESYLYPITDVAGLVLYWPLVRRQKRAWPSGQSHLTLPKMECLSVPTVGFVFHCTSAWLLNIDGLTDNFQGILPALGTHRGS